MDKLRKMAVFARVVELGSFASAAADQNVTPAIVGRHVADLEAMLGLRLINRTTRSMEVTDAGQRYYHGCKTMLDQMAELEQEVADRKGVGPSGIVRVAAPEGMGTPLMDAVESFQKLYPDVVFDLLIENDQTDFVSANIDLAVRLAISLEDSSLIVTKLAGTRLSLFAAPSYLESNGVPTTVQELDNHACLVFGGSCFGDSWPLLTKTGLRKLRQPWRMVVNQTHIYREALIRGMGIGLMPEIMALDLVEAQQLSPIYLDDRFPDVGVFGVYPDKAFQPQRVRLFLEHLRKTLSGKEA